MLMLYRFLGANHFKEDNYMETICRDATLKLSLGFLNRRIIKVFNIINYHKYMVIKEIIFSVF